jgi:hypothetical protein
MNISNIVSADTQTLVDKTSSGFSIRVNSHQIHAKITGSFLIGSSTFYTWVEVIPRVDGSGYEVLDDGQSGDEESCYAAEMNGSASVPEDTIVILRHRVVADTTTLGAGGTNLLLYEFMIGGGSGAVQSVQCVGGVLIVTYA